MSSGAYDTTVPSELSTYFSNYTTVPSDVAVDPELNLLMWVGVAVLSAALVIVVCLMVHILFCKSPQYERLPETSISDSDGQSASQGASPSDSGAE